MGLTHIEQALRRYEGLVFTTARMVAPYVEDPVEDIEQILRLKIWRALQAYDPSKARGLPEKRYVFMCMRNQVKDLAKKRKRNELMLEDLKPRSFYGGSETLDSFDAKYLSTSHDEEYGKVEDDDLLLPNTLTRLETAIVVRLYRDYKQAEIVLDLGIDRREMERLMKSIRQKLADWRPSSATEQRVRLAA